MRNGLVVLQPFASFGYRALFFFTDLFVLNRCVGESLGERIEHCLKQTEHGAELLGRQAVQIGVGLLPVMGKVESHSLTISPRCNT